MTNSAKIVTGVIVGTALGAVLGVLFAPEKGSSTRALLAKKAKKLGDSSSQTFLKTKKLLGIKKEKEEEPAMN